VWAWRKPGINSWLRAEPTCRTAFRKGERKRPEKVKKVKKAPTFVSDYVQNPRTPD